MRFSDPFFSELLAGVVDKASEHSFDLLIASHAAEQDETKSYLKYIRGRKVDGFLIIRTHLHDQRIELLRKHTVPFVVFGRVESNHTCTNPRMRSVYTLSDVAGCDWRRANRFTTGDFAAHIGGASIERSPSESR